MDKIDLKKEIDKAPQSEVAQKFTVVNNALRRSVKDNPADRITVEIGDTKQVDFQPQAKIMRWGDDEEASEVNFSIRRKKEWANPTVSTEGNRVRFIDTDEEVHIYELPDIDEDGGLEIELHLKTKPATNSFAFSIETKELDFFYQPALTEEEIDGGAKRPENVVGSYAVYHKTQKNNVVGGKEYKTGKAFHIYRPHVTDSGGNETWGELEINEMTKELVVTVPKEFLDTAVYPVIVDPTFGYTSIGASSETIASHCANASEAITIKRGWVESISVYINNVRTDTKGLKGLLAERSNGTLLENGVSNPLTIDHIARWNTVVFSEKPVVLAASTYWLAHIGNANMDAYYDSAPAEYSMYHPYTMNSYYDPTDLTSTTLRSRAMSIYATYTPRPVVFTQAVTNTTETTATGNGNITYAADEDITTRGFEYQQKPAAVDTLYDFEGGALAPLTTSGSANWTITSADKNSGTYSAKAGTITHSQSTTLTLTHTFGSDGYISFARKVSSENNWDFLRFRDSGTLVESWSGEQPWSVVSYPVTLGTHTFTWTYEKDGSVNSGADTAWIDDIIVTSTPPTTQYTTSETGIYSIGTFALPITGLVDSTSYLVRAYATNSFGTTYGEDVEFTTNVNLLPYDAIVVTEKVEFPPEVASVNTDISILEDITTAQGLGPFFEEIAISENIALTKIVNLSLAEESTVSEALSVSQSMNVYHYDDLTSSSALTEEREVSITSYTDIGLFEEITSSGLSDYNDVLTVSENIQLQVTTDLPLGEDVTISDGTEQVLSFATSVSDDISLEETTEYDPRFSFFAFDLISITEEKTQHVDVFRLVADVIGVSEATGAQTALHAYIFDTLNYDDVASVLFVFLNETNETVSISESLEVKKDVFLLIEEDIPLSEFINNGSEANYFLSVADNLFSASATSREKETGAAVFSAVSYDDAASALSSAGTATHEDIALAEHTEREVLYVLTIHDTVTTQEDLTLSRVIILEVDTGETIYLTESIDNTLDTWSSVFEEILLEEATERNIFFTPPLLFDEINISENTSGETFSFGFQWESSKGKGRGSTVVPRGGPALHKGGQKGMRGSAPMRPIGTL